MKSIVLDARTVFAKSRRGTGKNLVDLYTQIEQKRPDWKIRFYFSKGHDEYGDDLAFTNIQTVPLVDVGNRFNLWQDYLLPLVAKWNKADILHSPAQTSPKYIPCPTIVTIHDIIPLRMDDGGSASLKSELADNIRHSLKYAAVIITVSEYSKQDILDYFATNEEEKARFSEKIKVVHWAPEAKLLNIDAQGANQASLLHHYSLQNGQPIIDDKGQRKPFFFSLGAASPRKNTPRLLQAFADFCQTNSQWNLLLGGIQDKALPEFRRLIEDLNIADRVSLNGFLPEAHMPSLYFECDAFVFPSTYEGFGLPVLDAFASQSPLLVSNVTSLPEVAGEAAAYFDPQSNEEITNAMLKVANDEAYRAELIEAGKQRLKMFSWENTANQVIDIFEKVDV